MNASPSVIASRAAAVPDCAHDPTTLHARLFDRTGSSWPAGKEEVLGIQRAPVVPDAWGAAR